MALEKAWLARTEAKLISRKLQDDLAAEITKGCRSDILPHPVCLEPVFRPILAPKGGTSYSCTGDDIPYTPLGQNQWTQLQVWLSPEQMADWWTRSELMVKQLSCVSQPVALEIMGNEGEITIQFFCHQDDGAIVQAAFASQFEQSQLLVNHSDRLANYSVEAWQDAVFLDFYPSSRLYSHLLTRPDELILSPYQTLFSSLARFPKEVLGFYQVVFVPAAPQNNWMMNVQALVDMEYQIKLCSGLPTTIRYQQQAPSFDLQNSSNVVETKAHNDKPFFFAALRIGVIPGRTNASDLLKSLIVFSGQIQHGGRQLGALTQKDYRQYLSPAAIVKMFSMRLVHRPGFLLNSCELTSLVHIPPLSVTEHLQSILIPLEDLPPDASIQTGTPIGFCRYADKNLPVCIPDEHRFRHCHIIGKPDMGKSSLMLYTIIHDIQQNHSVIVLDPHGTLVDAVLKLVPRESVDRVIYLNLGDPSWIPIWNPLRTRPGIPLERIADEFVSIFKNIVDGWGDKMENFMRQSLLAILHLEDGSLLDVYNLLRKKSQKSKILRKEILTNIEDNETLRAFWEEDFLTYTAADVFPPRHKYIKILGGGTVSLMLSQPDSQFDLYDVMQQGTVLLINLFNMGPELQSIVGCFILALLEIYTKQRQANRPELLVPCHIYCDEAPRFITNAVDNLIVEARKFKVSLTLSHQYLRQFSIERADALSSVGSTIIYNVNEHDASRLKQNLQGRIKVEELIRQEKGQAVASINNHIVRVNTHYVRSFPEENYKEQIIALSRRRYYKPVGEVREIVRQHNRRFSTQDHFNETRNHQFALEGNRVLPDDIQADLEKKLQTLDEFF